MLQLSDQSLLETVMSNVVVFSRMKPYQKGQVMDLLGTRGLHRIVAGQQQHLPVSHHVEHPHIASASSKTIDSLLSFSPHPDRPMTPLGPPPLF